MLAATAGPYGSSNSVLNPGEGGLPQGVPAVRASGERDEDGGGQTGVNRHRSDGRCRRAARAHCADARHEVGVEAHVFADWRGIEAPTLDDKAVDFLLADTGISHGVA